MNINIELWKINKQLEIQLEEQLCLYLWNEIYDRLKNQLANQLDGFYSQQDWQIYKQFENENDLGR